MVKIWFIRQFSQRKEALDGMLRIVTRRGDKQRFYDAFDHHQKNATVIGNIDYENQFGCTAERMKDKITQFQDTLSLENNFKKAIQAAQQKMADKVIRNSVMASSIIIILQVIKLHFIWKEISVAETLHNNSTKFKQIGANIVMLKNITEELT